MALKIASRQGEEFVLPVSLVRRYRSKDRVNREVIFGLLQPL